MVRPDLRRNRPAAGPLVQRFTADGFSVDGVAYRAVLLTPERAAAWEPPPLGELGIGHVETALAIDPAPEFLILGTGSTLVFPPRGLVQALEARGVGLEAMDSRAAARTWGLLRGEDRWIAAALLPL